jgi:hypothetical protein
MTQFHWTSGFFLTVFISVMIGATFIAFSRKSGNTKMDMGKVHLIRSKIVAGKE